MAKAKSLVGLDVHATKIVAAVLDAETGQLQLFAMSGGDGEGGRVLRGAAAAGAGRVRGRPDGLRVGARARQARRGVCRRGAEQDPPGDAGIGSRPIVVTPSISSGCCWPESCTRSGCRATRRRRCVTWSARVSGADGSDALPAPALEAAAAARDPLR